MKKITLIILLLLLSINCSAFDFPSLPYNFQPRQLISASKIMANYNALKNALIDATKKLNIAELWINGNRVIENDLDINGKDLNLSGNVFQKDIYRCPSQYSTLELTLDAIGTSTADIIIDGVATLSSSRQITSNIKNITFTSTGQISGAYTLTFDNNQLKASEDQQVFGDNLTATGNISNKNIHPAWFGAVGEGNDPDTGTDDSTSLNKAAEFCTSRNVLSIDKMYAISSRVYVNAFISVIGRGRGTGFQALADFTPSNDSMISVNVSGNTWIQSFPNIAGTVGDFELRGKNDLNDLDGIYISGGYHIRDIQTQFIDNGIRTTARYEDSLKISHVFFSSMQGSEYAIILNQLGDALDISNVHFTGTESDLGIYVDACTGGGTITNIINGRHRFDDCTAVTVKNGLMGNEAAGDAIFEINNSNMTLENIYIINDGANIPIVIDDVSNERSLVTLRDLKFIYKLSNTSAKTFDVKKAYDQAVISIDNCVSIIVDDDEIETNQTSGITIADSSGVSFDRFNNYSYELSKRSCINGDFVNYGFNIQGQEGEVFHTGAIVTDSARTWQESSGTYYYEIQHLYDRDRLIGRNDSTSSNVTLTNGGDGAKVSFSMTAFNASCWLRFYRGTSAENYNAYVDVPVITSREFYDDGISLNGWVWASRPTADITTPTTVDNTARFFGDNVEIYRTAVPTSTDSSFVTADITLRNNPTVDSITISGDVKEVVKNGWICTEAGSPGTWKEMKILTGN